MTTVGKKRAGLEVVEAAGSVWLRMSSGGPLIMRVPEHLAALYARLVGTQPDYKGWATGAESDD